MFILVENDFTITYFKSHKNFRLFQRTIEILHFFSPTFLQTGTIAYLNISISKSHRLWEKKILTIMQKKGFVKNTLLHGKKKKSPRFFS